MEEQQDFLLFLVGTVPINSEYGPRAVPSAYGIGVYHILDSEVQELTCDQSSCSWTQRPQEFTTDFKRRDWFQAMYIPKELTKCGATTK